MITQIFIVGASSVYGVGSESGGFADMIKKTLHNKMYSEEGIGDKFEVFNFGKSGAQIDFVLKTFPEQIKNYGRDGKIITIVSVGGNNIKAKGTPDNFISTIEEYSSQMSELLDKLKKLSTQVITVGSGYYDENKTTPKISPFDGTNSYFFNKRKKQFEEELKKLSKKKNIPFVEIKVSEKEWVEKYLYKDGLHANKKGHELIHSAIMAELVKII